MDQNGSRSTAQIVRVRMRSHVAAIEANVTHGGHPRLWARSASFLGFVDFFAVPSLSFRTSFLQEFSLEWEQVYRLIG